ncbi:receptor-transporting protein 3-like [Chrysemys picta bellii]|uniref:receptor-transporting protein 3-like n=1 Tax=Chrysemys picta bellii TaxID=8478 RepID=UPI0032B15807
MLLLKRGCKGEGENTKTWQRMFDQKMEWEKPNDTWSLTVEDNLSPRNPERRWHLYQQRKAFARFQCSCCTRHWPSAQVLILFHMHLDRSQRQGQVKMRVYGQKCKKCHGAKFETPTFSQENIERILDKLVLKVREKCYRESIANRDLADPVVEEDVGGPHDTTRCEACALGICYLKIQPYSSSYGFVRPTSPAAASQPGQQAWQGADAESDWKLLCFVVVLLIFAVLFSGK